MKETIRENLGNPAQLEELYRNNKPAFKEAFGELYPEVQHHPAARFWYERLHYRTTSDGVPGLVMMMLLLLLASLLARVPDIFGISPDYYYPRHLGFIAFSSMSLFFIRRAPKSVRFMAALAFVITAVYINLLPGTLETDTLALACMHLPLLLWATTGYVYAQTRPTNWLKFLKFNGDLLLLSAILLIAGGLVSALTINLFRYIGLHIEAFYVKQIVPVGLAAVPVVATYLGQKHPQLISRVSVIIARIFSPLVLAMLVIYLVTMIYAGRSPYHDREFLVVFNLLLLGVMALIFFSVAGDRDGRRTTAENWVLTLLSVVTVIVNGIALSAIVFRIAEWGFTPNRLAVLGSNLLVLVHLVWISVGLLKMTVGKPGGVPVGIIITRFIPVYIAWAGIVVFLFPVMFEFM